MVFDRRYSGLTHERVKFVLQQLLKFDFHGCTNDVFWARNIIGKIRSNKNSCKNNKIWLNHFGLFISLHKIQSLWLRAKGDTKSIIKPALLKTKSFIVFNPTRDVNLGLLDHLWLSVSAVLPLTPPAVPQVLMHLLHIKWLVNSVDYYDFTKLDHPRLWFGFLLWNEF